MAKLPSCTLCGEVRMANGMCAHCDFPCKMGRMCIKCAMGEAYDGTDPGRKPWV